jgi:hypothetical protein
LDANTGEAAGAAASVTGVSSMQVKLGRVSLTSWALGACSRGCVDNEATVIQMSRWCACSSIIHAGDLTLHRCSHDPTAKRGATQRQRRHRC